MSKKGQPAVRPATLCFVEYENSKLPADPTVRKTIQRYAMRDVANTRKRKQNYSKRNVGQYPKAIFELMAGKTGVQTSSPRIAAPLGRVATTNPTQIGTEALADAIIAGYQRQNLAPIPISDSEANMAGNMRLLSLVESLIGWHMGGPSERDETYRGGPVQPELLPHLSSFSLLSFIPSRYGKNDLITHATDCLIERLRRLLNGGGTSIRAADTAILSHYAKALNVLQSSIDDSKLRMLPETLCAMEILYFFEVSVVILQIFVKPPMPAH